MKPRNCGFALLPKQPKQKKEYAPCVLLTPVEYKLIKRKEKQK